MPGSTQKQTPTPMSRLISRVQPHSPSARRSAVAQRSLQAGRLTGRLPGDHPGAGGPARRPAPTRTPGCRRPAGPGGSAGRRRSCPAARRVGVDSASAAHFADGSTTERDHREHRRRQHLGEQHDRHQLPPAPAQRSPAPVEPAADAGTGRRDQGVVRVEPVTRRVPADRRPRVPRLPAVRTRPGRVAPGGREHPALRWRGRTPGTLRGIPAGRRSGGAGGRAGRGTPGPQPAGGPAWPGPPTGEDGSDGSGSPDPEDGVGGGGWSVMNAPQHRLERFTIFPAARPCRQPRLRRGRSAQEVQAMTRTCSACGPFWPWVISNSTRWPSSSAL